MLAPLQLKVVLFKIHYFTESLPEQRPFALVFPEVPMSGLPTWADVSRCTTIYTSRLSGRTTLMTRSLLFVLGVQWFPSGTTPTECPIVVGESSSPTV